MIPASPVFRIDLPRFRPQLSSIVRLLWIAVALLHGWLAMRRVVSGEWLTFPDMARLLLGVTGTAYCTVKVWRVSTIFDAEPRRAIMFALLLVLTHWLVTPPANPVDTFLDAPIAVLVAAPALVMFASVAARRPRPRRSRAYRLLPATRPRVSFQFALASLPLAIMRHDPSLQRRPPPAPLV